MLTSHKTDLSRPSADQAKNAWSLTIIFLCVLLYLSTR